MLRFPTETFVVPSERPLKNNQPFLSSFEFHADQTEIDKILKTKEAELSNIYRCPQCEIILTRSIISLRDWTCSICRADLHKVLTDKQYLEDVERKNAPSIGYSIRHVGSKIKPDNVIIVCFDASASMASTYSNGDRDNTEYLSRFEIFVKALEKSILTLKSKKKFNNKLFLIVFNDNVTLYGDLISGNKVEISGELSKNEIIQKAKVKAASLCKRNINESPNLGTILKDLITLDKNQQLVPSKSTFFCNGQTALGPSIAAALGVLQGLNVKNSQILIMTDGYSNVGFGRLDILKDQNNQEIGASYRNLLMEYEDMGEAALRLGSSFHIFGFDDEPVGLGILQNLVTEKGKIYKVQITKDKIVSNFDVFQKTLEDALLSSENVFANQAELILYFSNAVQLKYKNQELIDNVNLHQRSILKTFLGNLSAENSLSFIYEILKKELGDLIFHFELSYLDHEFNTITIVCEKKLRPTKVMSFEKIDVELISSIFFSQRLFRDPEIKKQFIIFLMKMKFKGNINTIDKYLNKLTYFDDIELKKNEITYLEEIAKTEIDAEEKKKEGKDDEDFPTRFEDDDEEEKKEIDVQISNIFSKDVSPRVWKNVEVKPLMLKKDNSSSNLNDENTLKRKKKY